MCVGKREREKKRLREGGRKGRGTEGERGVSVYVVMCVRVCGGGEGREGGRKGNGEGVREREV